MKAIIALGSNLGDRRAHLDAGLRELGALGRVVCSPLVMETSDESGTGPAYLNTVACLETPLEDPRHLLEELLRIELRCGRERPSPSNWPRTLDLDLISVDGMKGCWEWAAPEDLTIVAETFTLILPHPRAHSRAFVLEPMARLGFKT